MRIFIHFTSAFDNIKYELLMTKLTLCGVRGGTSFRPVYSIANSEWNATPTQLKDVKSCVSQSMSLGPPLFILYFTYTLQVNTRVGYVPYRCDISICITGRDSNRIATLGNSFLYDINEWYITHFLTSNTKKKKTTIFMLKMR